MNFKKLYLLILTSFGLSVLPNLQAQHTEVIYNSSNSSPQLQITEETDNGYGRIFFRNNGGLSDRFSLASRLGTNSLLHDFGVYYNGTSRLLYNEAGKLFSLTGVQQQIDYNSTSGNPGLMLNELDAGFARFTMKNTEDGFWTIAARSGNSDDFNIFYDNGADGENLFMIKGEEDLTEIATLLTLTGDGSSGSQNLKIFEESATDYARIGFENEGSTNRWNIAARPGAVDNAFVLSYNSGFDLTLLGDAERAGFQDGTPEYTVSIDHGSGSPVLGSDHGLNIQNTGADANGANWTIYTRTSSGGDLQLFFDDNTTANPVLRGTFNSSNGVYTNNSDLALKKNISTLENQLEKLMQLRPTRYQFKEANEGDEYSIGFIAQEVKEIIPDVVSNISTTEEHGADYLGISYSELIPVIIGGMQEQQKIIESLQKEIETLKKK